DDHHVEFHALAFWQLSRLGNSLVSAWRHAAVIPVMALSCQNEKELSSRDTTANLPIRKMMTPRAAELHNAYVNVNYK
ncbi:hypothetical protein ACC728_39725, partial [Rhizobium ruizarguesonis]